MERSAVAAAHKWMAPSLRSAAKGRRAFCNWDEGSITMTVEVVRDALNKTPAGDIAKVFLASTTMPFADLLNVVVASDGPRGKPASTQEIGFGAGAAAFTLGSENVVADFLEFASSTSSVVDHLRPSDNKYDYC